MSESKKIKLNVIPQDSIVTLGFSGEFHKRLVGAYFNYVSKIDTAILISNLEKKFIDAGFNKEKEFDIPIED